MAKPRPTPGLFITGNDTEVGKTHVGVCIARQLRDEGVRIGVYKPAASGAELLDGRLVCDDAQQLWQAAGCPLTPDIVCPQVFAAPLAPHRAAMAEQRRIDTDLLRVGLQPWLDFDFVLVEGAGGLMSPLSEQDYVADLAWDFGFPLLIVASNALGVVNQTLQTLITASTFRDGLPIAGVVLNDLRAELDASCESNEQELRARCVPPLLGRLPHGAETFEPPVDWRKLAGI